MLEGRQDRIAACGIDRWLGGVPPATSGRRIDDEYVDARGTSVYQVGTIARGGTANLWARVRNGGGSALPAGTTVWFAVADGAATKWVGGTALTGLAAGAEQWFLLQWTVPANSPVGTYTYWAQAWSSTAAISAWSAGQTFTVY